MLMIDLLFIGLIVAFYAMSLGLIAVCQRGMED
jgi:hypothetical protein